MTAKEGAKWIGSVLMVKDGAIQYEAEVLDAKIVYGDRLLLVKPVAGTGQKWIKTWGYKGGV
jgi:hypothetical protein